MTLYKKKNKLSKNWSPTVFFTHNFKNANIEVSVIHKMVGFPTADSSGTHSVRKDIKVCECGKTRAPVLRQHRGSGLGVGTGRFI